MSEACPLGLNYGHFGEPSYDSENQEWHFPRQPGRTRELRLIGQPVRALQSSLHGPTAHIQTATERSQNIKDLSRQYPELLPASSLLPRLAQISEVVDDITSVHDPTVSELLAFGEAIEPGKNTRGSVTVPVAAVAGGFAGEAVRLILLTKEKLGWEESKKVRLSAFSSRSGEEGWWSGNRGPIQQLVFAESEGRSSSWLAVRYYGAISVLRPQLLRNADLLQLAYAAPYRQALSHLDANHIVTLSIDQANHVPYSDVTFNPWYNQQIATIDQRSIWAVWDIEKIEKRAKGRRVWTIKKVRSGGMLDGLPQGETPNSRLADGWGVVLWAGDLSTIIVADRRTLAVFDITGDPRRLSAPNLLSATAPEWILDVKRSSKDLTHVFVTTTSSIFWLQVVSFARNREAEETPAGAKCLLSWRHFRDPEDISLRLWIADDAEKDDVDDDRGTTLVLLHSRSTGLTSVFTFHHKQSDPNLTPSASDPYLLRLPDYEPDFLAQGANPHTLIKNYIVSTGILKAMKYESPQGSSIYGLGKTYVDNDVEFYQLSLLTKDFTLLECLYAEVPTGFNAEVRPPKVVSRLEIAKTPAKVVSDFIVPNGYVDREYEDSPHNRTAEEESDSESRTSLAVLYEDPFTINFEWLENGTLTGPPLTIAFHEILESLQTGIEDKVVSGVSIMELLHVGSPRVSILDLDKASGDFVDFLDDIKQLTFEHKDSNDMDEERQVVVSNILIPPLQAGLGLRGTDELSSIYEILIQTWIVPLSRRIPGRVRIALEKLLRDLAGQICLASHAMRVDIRLKGEDEAAQPENVDNGAQFELPVRRRRSATSLSKGKGKERSDVESPPPPPPPPASPSQISSDTAPTPSSAVEALPTPEPTPSLRSRSSISSLTSSGYPSAGQRLQAYASLTPQPPLPTGIQTLLDHWECGADPGNYDWEAVQHATTIPGNNSGDESPSPKKLKKQQDQGVAAETPPRKKAKKSPVRPPSSSSSSQPTLSSERQQAQQSQHGTHNNNNNNNNNPPPHQSQEGGSSTQPAEEQAEERAITTMSQIEPGKFGGRNTNKSNKKKKVLNVRGGSHRPGF